MSAPATYIGHDGYTYPNRNYRDESERAAAIRLAWGEPKPADDADDAPACSVCGDYLEGDKETGVFCPSCDASPSWRYA